MAGPALAFVMLAKYTDSKICRRIYPMGNFTPLFERTYPRAGVDTDTFRPTRGEFASYGQFPVYQW